MPPFTSLPRRSVACSLLLLLSASLHAEPVPLFDGKSLDGWKQLGGKATYAVEDSAIVGTSVLLTPNSFLTTEKDYGDFVLEFDFKVDKGLNSGVQFRSQSKPDYKDGRVHGYQAEIDPNEPEKTGGIYDEGRRGWISDVRKTDAGDAVKAAFKPDDWNHYRIEAKGDHIRTWVNGVPASDFHDSVDASGFIGLQVHSVGPGDVGKTVRWKNITIEEIE